jgi:hypothetical protein
MPLRASDVKRWIEEKRSFPPDLSADEGGQIMPITEDFGNFLVAFDGHWTHFWSKDSQWEDRCRFEEAMELPRLPDCAQHCWKLLMFERRSEEVWESMERLLPFISQGEIEALKHSGDAVLSGGHQEYVIVIYTWGQDQRDKLKERLHQAGFTNIPWRRGCKAFEERFGPWRTWFKSQG